MMYSVVQLCSDVSTRVLVSIITQHCVHMLWDQLSVCVCCCFMQCKTD